MSGYDSGQVDWSPGDGYLIKPFDLDDMVRMIAEQLERARAG